MANVVNAAETRIKQLKAAVTLRAVIGMFLIVLAAVGMATIASWGTVWFLVAIGMIAVGLVVLWTAWKPASELDNVQNSLNNAATEPATPAAPARPTNKKTRAYVNFVTEEADDALVEAEEVMSAAERMEDEAREARREYEAALARARARRRPTPPTTPPTTP